MIPQVPVSRPCQQLVSCSVPDLKDTAVCCRKNIISHCLSTKTSKSNWVNRKTPQGQRGLASTVMNPEYSQYSRNLLVYSLFATRIHLFHLIIIPSTCIFCSSPIFFFTLLFFFFGLSPSLSFSLFSHKTTSAILTYEPWKTAPKSRLETTQHNEHTKRCSASLVNSKGQILSHDDIISHPPHRQNLYSDDVSCLEAYGATGTPERCWMECKLAQLLCIDLARR